jgi:hypothetical protein
MDALLNIPQNLMHAESPHVGHVNANSGCLNFGLFYSFGSATLFHVGIDNSSPRPGSAGLALRIYNSSFYDFWAGTKVLLPPHGKFVFYK